MDAASIHPPSPRSSSDGPCPDALPPSLPDGRAWPKISIITPSFNQGRYIEETFRSVAEQGYPNVEHIVIDGGSTDGTLDVLERYKGRLAYVVSEPDRGQTHAINKGFARATGEILTWLNSDDMLAPGALAAAAMGFSTSGADMVAGICLLHRDGRPLSQHLTSCQDGPLPLEELLDLNRCWLAGQFFYQPEVMFTRELWERAGGRLEETWYYSMDYELWLRFAEHGARLHVIGRPIALYRVHPEQKTSAPARFRAELVKVRDAFCRRTGRNLRRYPPPRKDRKRLRMVFFNDVGPLAGAGLAHGRFAQACAWAGHDVFCVAATEKVNLGLPKPLPTAAVLGEIGQYGPDVVVVGNLHGAGLGADMLAAISERWPTIFVLHDLWALTGRCPYPSECSKHLSGCDETCPTATDYPRLEPDNIADAWNDKRRLLGGDDSPYIFGDSEWTTGVVRAALGQQDSTRTSAGRPPIDTIRYGFPLDQFRPRDRRQCRELLNLPQDSFIIMTGACAVTDPRKGVAHLAAALDKLDLPDVLVVAAGHVHEDRMAAMPNMRAMGYIQRPEQLSCLYSAADLFVAPSLEEAFGQVYVEAAACGTPAIGYPVGGVPEAIADEITGRIARRVDPDALAEAIHELYVSADLRRDMRVWARLYVENEWSLAACYQRLVGALQRVGLRDRLGLAPKIGFRPVRPTSRPTHYLGSVYPEWKAANDRAARECDRETSACLFPLGSLYPSAMLPGGEPTTHLMPPPPRLDTLTRQDKCARMSEVLHELADQGVRRVALYGAGRHTLDVIPALNEAPVEIGGLIDDRTSRRVAGWVVVPPQDAARLGIDAVVLSSDVYEDQMWARRGLFESQGLRVVRLYGRSAGPARAPVTCA